MWTVHAAPHPATRPAIAAAAILTLPLVAMQFTEQVDWSPADFVFMGALIFGTGLLFELASRRSGSTAYRVGAGMGLLAALLLVWVNGAVGIIGSENNPANLMYLGVLAVAAIGAVWARFRAAELARALWMAALAQALVTGIAVALGLGAPEDGPVELLAINGFFLLLWIFAAGLLREAGREGQ